MKEEELLEQILAKLEEITVHMDQQDAKLDHLSMRLGILESKVDLLDSKLERGYRKEQDFQDYQRNWNMAMSGCMNELPARLEIFEQQTVKNTADLSAMKRQKSLRSIGKS